MLRIVLGLLALITLSSCSGGAKYQSMFTGRSMAEVAGALEQVHGKVSFDGYLNPPRIDRTRPRDDTILYTIAPRDGNKSARIQFTMVESDNGTRVFIDSDVPEITAEIGGETKTLSKDKLEAQIHSGLASLSQAFANGRSRDTAIEKLNESIAFAALATDPDEVNRALKLAGSLGLLSEHERAWNSDSQHEWAEADGVMDSADGMDIEAARARGTRPMGADTRGENPSPDGEWGSASDW